MCPCGGGEFCKVGEGIFESDIDYCLLLVNCTLKHVWLPIATLGCGLLR